MSSDVQRVAPEAQPDSRENQSREELCGNHIGDRRVRVQRQPRTVSKKLASIVRRTLSR
ncbi:MAG: hypothetical protein KC458_04240 [Dehalococcoidia bacterium]|nr:hypothetical protein [Dehalococcoidia bacterium]MCA9856468.1 hypothetical protein [Dehalococcoidia bacterium]MCB9482776.1 hypothetical protein [Dehalococcoidia bacterium]